MSVTHGKAISNTRQNVSYVLYGAPGSEKEKQHRGAGTTRSVYQINDLGSPEAFVEAAEHISAGTGELPCADASFLRGKRRVEARSFVHSFESEEYSKHREGDAEQVAGLGYEWAKEMFPNSYVMVNVHDDGVGGKLHNHIHVLNHDNLTGRALNTHWQHHEMAEANDRVMQRNGARVVQRSAEHHQQAVYWEHKRDDPGLSQFQRWLGESVMDCAADPRAVGLATFDQLLAEHGISRREHAPRKMRASKDGRTAEYVSKGWSFEAVDRFSDPGVTRAGAPRKRRTRRMSASKIDSSLMEKNIEDVFEDNRAVAAEITMQRQAAQQQPLPGVIDERKVKERQDERDRERAVVAGAARGEEARCTGSVGAGGSEHGKGHHTTEHAPSRGADPDDQRADRATPGSHEEGAAAGRGEPADGDPVAGEGRRELVERLRVQTGKRVRRGEQQGEAQRAADRADAHQPAGAAGAGTGNRATGQSGEPGAAERTGRGAGRQRAGERRAATAGTAATGGQSERARRTSRRVAGGARRSSRSSQRSRADDDFSL